MKTTTTLWSVPVGSIPFIINAIEEYASKELYLQHYKEVEDTMYCIQGVKEDYEEIQNEYAQEVH